MRARELVSRDVHRIALGEASVEYVLLRRRGRRGVGLRVDETGLTVSAPATLPVARIESVIRESAAWVIRKVGEWQTRQVPRAAWGDGAALPLLGGHLALRLREGTRLQAERVDDELLLKAPPGVTEAAIRAAVVAWYKRFALHYLKERVAAHCARSGIEPPRLMLSSALARWGSCNARREVRLTWRLVKAPEALVDYVICHELAHLRHMNHSRAFWAEVERLCPGHRLLRKRLLATDHLYRSF
jgi:predicted metal-dependent hydrolase